MNEQQQSFDRLSLSYKNVLLFNDLKFITKIPSSYFRPVFLLAFCMSIVRSSVYNKKKGSGYYGYSRPHLGIHDICTQYGYFVLYHSHASLLQGNGGRYTSLFPASFAKHHRLILLRNCFSSMNARLKNVVLRQRGSGWSDRSSGIDDRILPYVCRWRFWSLLGNGNSNWKKGIMAGSSHAHGSVRTLVKSTQTAKRFIVSSRWLIPVCFQNLMYHHQQPREEAANNVPWNHTSVLIPGWIVNDCCSGTPSFMSGRYAV